MFRDTGAICGTLVSVGAVGSVVLATLTIPTANATAYTSFSPRSSTCTSIPALTNGGFEDFSNPDNGGVANDKPTNNGYGWWHGYTYGGAIGPDQILFLKTDGSVPSNYVTGWRTTDANGYIEIQRQVTTYTNSTDESGTVYGPYAPARSGVATAATTLAGGNYWDKYGPQAAQGSYWAELNALTDSALYQDLTVSNGDQMFWSIKHRGRTQNNEQMKVLVGPVGSLVEQTTIYKYSPTNADVYVGYPAYGSSYSNVSQIITPLGSGWNQYEGAYLASASGPLRFQFQAVGGSPFGNAFGNLLDDIQFTVFLACPASRSLSVGQSVSINTSDAPLSYGIRQELVGISNTTAPLSEFSTAGNTVTFTPTSPGTFTADYTMRMTFGGTTYSRSSTLTYVVSPGPAPPAPPTWTLNYDANGGTCAAPSQSGVNGTVVATYGASACTRPGYTFTGWNTRSNGTGDSFTPGASTQLTADGTLYAQWVAIQIAATDESFITGEGTPVDGDVSTNDTVPAGSQYAVSSNPSHGTVVVNSNGTFTYTPRSRYSGIDSFTYEVCAAGGVPCASATVTITITPRPIPPVVTPPSVPVTGTVVIPGVTPPGAVFTVVTPPVNGVVVLQPTGQYVYTPEPEFVGTDSFTYQQCSNAGTSCKIGTVRIFVVSVSDVDAKPRVKSASTTSPAPIFFKPRTSITGGQIQIAQEKSNTWVNRIVVPGEGTWLVTNKRVTFTPKPNFYGRSRIQYRVINEDGSVGTSTFTAVRIAMPSLIDGGR